MYEARSTDVPKRGCRFAYFYAPIGSFVARYEQFRCIIVSLETGGRTCSGARVGKRSVENIRLTGSFDTTDYARSVAPPLFLFTPNRLCGIIYACTVVRKRVVSREKKN